jgi:BirA family biotin operon repressor/biotin-[acetyl-CoA-carboxylase] ligase
MGVTLQRLESTPSTQDVLHQMAAAGAPAGTAIVARVQTVGRGSRGRSWESPPGGLWLSVLLRPVAAPAVEVLSLRVALAASAAIESQVPGVLIQLKWPNDLLLAGRKLGGILCEARWQGGAPGWVAVGIGVNVANPIPADLALAAIALASLWPDADPELLVGPVAESIAALTDRAGTLTDQELAEYRGRDWLAGRPIRAPVSGIPCGVARDGALMVRGEDGTLQEIRSGTVLPAAG